MIVDELCEQFTVLQELHVVVFDLLGFSYTEGLEFLKENCDDCEHCDVEIYHCVENQMEHVLIDIVLKIPTFRHSY